MSQPHFLRVLPRLLHELLVCTMLVDGLKLKIVWRPRIDHSTSEEYWARELLTQTHQLSRKPVDLRKLPDLRTFVWSQPKYAVNTTAAVLEQPCCSSVHLYLFLSYSSPTLVFRPRTALSILTGYCDFNFVCFDHTLVEERIAPTSNLDWLDRAWA